VSSPVATCRFCVQALGCAAALSAWVACSGCASKPELATPRSTLAPYDTSRGELLWAVAPLRNESATSTVDSLAISDCVVEAVEQVKGVRAVPMNRTIETMRALKMPLVQTPGDARKLADALGVDALVVGTITTYEPYDPKLGLALALVPRTAVMQSGSFTPAPTVDPRAVQSSATEIAPPPKAGEPASAVSELFDGKNQAVQMDIRTFAEGRSEAVSANGWRRYLKSVDLFSEFAAYRTIDALMQAETVRLATAAPLRGTSPSKATATPPEASASPQTRGE
jgi:hypothetical protein